MKKQLKIQRIQTLLVSFLTVISILGCQAKPVLRSVVSDAAEKPINTPEAAIALKKKHE